MDSWLKIEIVINDEGNLSVIDSSEYTTWIEDGIFDEQHIVYDRVLSYTAEPEVIKSRMWLAESPEALQNNDNDEIDLPGDGWYRYERILIPVDGHDGESDLYATYTIEDADAEEDEDKYKVVIWEKDGTGTPVEITVEDAFDELLEDRTDGNTFYYAEDIFSIFDLIKCYVLTEKQRIINWLKNNCRSNCNEVSTINSNARLLLAAVNVLTYLIGKREFAEAQRILNGLSTCGSLCKNFDNRLKGCGCGKSS